MNEKVDNRTSKNVFVVGPNLLQNELIAFMLQEQTDLSCFVVQDGAPITQSIEGIGDGACLALYDCMGKDGKACLADLERNGEVKDLMAALFNLERGKGFERSAFTLGARGFFYSEEPFSRLVKGVVAMFEGELWISRQLLSEWIQQEIRPLGRTHKQLLSEREKEILTLLAGGATNKEIAAALFISTHTVKNHLQRTFKKINVHSKTQAAVWAARNIPI